MLSSERIIEWGTAIFGKRITGSRRRVSTHLAFTAALAMVAVGCGSTGGGTPDAQALSTASEASASAPAFIRPQGSAWGDTWSINPYNSSWNDQLDEVSLLSLAIAKPPKLGAAYIPELATSWKVTTSQVRITLRRDARWQNGKAVTSHDVLISLELSGAIGNNLWAQTSGMTTPSTHTLVIDVRPGQSGRLLLYNVLAQYPSPASEYAQFVPAGFQRDLVHYYGQPSTATATTSPAGKAITNVATSVAKYVPPSFIGDGPYRELGITTSEMKLQLWTGFWDAKRIHVASIIEENFAENSNIPPQYYSHQADWGNNAMSKTILQRWLHTSDHGYRTMSAYTQYGIDFNNRHYPLSKVAFRQAIAYVVNRQTASLAAYNGLKLAKPDRYEDGVDYSLQASWLTPSELKKLNTYPHDLAKATSLLHGLHFSKKNGRWIEPNGTPVELNLTYEGGDSDSEGMAESVGSQLTNFGLKTQVIGAATPTYSSEIPAGTFEIGWEFVGGGGLDPLADQASEIGTSNNFPPVTSGSAKTKAGLGFGPSLNVPGLGRVRVAPTITREASTIGPGQQMANLVWRWAQVINKDLPYLVISDKVQQVENSTYHYVDWPPARSSDWSLMGLNLSGGLLVALEQGYIRPRS